MTILRLLQSQPGGVCWSTGVLIIAIILAALLTEHKRNGRNSDRSMHWT